MTSGCAVRVRDTSGYSHGEEGVWVESARPQLQLPEALRPYVRDEQCRAPFLDLKDILPRKCVSSRKNSDFSTP